MAKKNYPHWVIKDSEQDLYLCDDGEFDSKIHARSFCDVGDARRTAVKYDCVQVVKVLKAEDEITDEREEDGYVIQHSENDSLFWNANEDLWDTYEECTRFPTDTEAFFTLGGICSDLNITGKVRSATLVRERNKNEDGPVPGVVYVFDTHPDRPWIVDRVKNENIHSVGREGDSITFGTILDWEEELESGSIQIVYDPRGA